MSAQGGVVCVKHLADELRAISDTLNGHVLAGEQLICDVAGIVELSTVLHRIAADLSHQQTTLRTKARWKRANGNVIKLLND